MAVSNGCLRVVAALLGSATCLAPAFGCATAVRAYANPTAVDFINANVELGNCTAMRHSLDERIKACTRLLENDNPDAFVSITAYRNRAEARHENMTGRAPAPTSNALWPSARAMVLR